MKAFFPLSLNTSMRINTRLNDINPLTQKGEQRWAGFLGKASLAKN